MMKVYINVEGVLEKLGARIFWNDFENREFVAIEKEDSFSSIASIEMSLNEVPFVFANGYGYSKLFSKEALLIEIEIDDNIENVEEFVKKETERKINEIVKFIENKKKLISKAEEIVYKKLEEIQS